MSDIELYALTYLESNEYKDNIRKINYEVIEHKKFIEEYTIESILKMDIDNYVIGKGDSDSFCYYMERKLRGLGSILGGTAKKFGIYYDKKK